MLDTNKKPKPLKEKVWLSSPTMHGEELKYIKKAYDTNWMSTVGENIDEIEQRLASFVGRKYAVALSCGTTALHLAIRLAAKKLYHDGGGGGKDCPGDDGRPSYDGCSTKVPRAHIGFLVGKRVFCSDMTFAATVNPVAYEGGEAIFIDSEPDTWNMDPEALEKAFSRYPDVRLVVLAHLYGTPAKIDEIKAVCEAHGAILIEDAAESLGATYKEIETGAFGDYSVFSFNGNKIITGSAGGMFLCDLAKDAYLVRKWSTQSREDAPWYQHIDLGYNYRMSNVIAGVVRGQLPHLDAHIAAKKAIYERYKEGLKDLPVRMNPYDTDVSMPNFWLSSITIEKEAMCEIKMDEHKAIFIPEHGKSCPAEILGLLGDINAEGRPIWKPMHLEPIYRVNDFVTKNDGNMNPACEDIFLRGLCLPSDNKMTEKEQDVIIEAIKHCFD